MDFVALLSGGKDSCYNIHHCIANGHRLVCLANLSPVMQDCGNEELHSFMYQSAGSSVIPAYEHCLGVPLMIREILGKAVDQSMHYDKCSQSGGSATEQDEVEDLFELLNQVVTRFPSIKGVSCGAIVSNYQRIRVENVCERLGLTVLSYLWQKDRRTLLNELIDDGIDAILVKVAGAGLDPYKHLGKSLRFLHPTLESLHNKYGLDLCGEGGEYESLVLDAPFFRKRIIIEEKMIFLDEEDSTVGNLKIISYRLEEKAEQSIHVPRLKNALSSVLADNLSSVLSLKYSTIHLNPSEASLSQSFNFEKLIDFNKFLSSNLEDGLVFTDLLLPDISNHRKIGHDLVIEQVRALVDKLRQTLTEGSGLHDIVFVHLYINDIRWFGAVNEEYCKYFGKHPPSRSCIMASLPQHICVALDAMYLKHSHQAAINNQPLRQVLHVKSISDWAPLCIGPYAQCNSLYNHTLSLVAGQIPLNPSTMSLRATPSAETTPEIAGDELKLDLMLSTRHIARVLNTQCSNLQSCLTLVIYLNTTHPWNKTTSCEFWSQELKPLLQKVAMTNYSAEKEDNTPSPQHDSLFCDDLLNEEQEQWDEGDEGDEGKEESPAQISEGAPLVTLVGVPGLPRDAALEIEGVAIKKGILPIDKRRSSNIKKIISSNNYPHFSGLLDFSFHPSCFGNGSILILCYDRTLINHAQVSSFIGTMILQCLSDIQVQLVPSALKCVRLFFLPAVFGDVDQVQILFKAISQTLGIKGIGLVCIPCCQLEHNAIVNCVFQCVDFEQIETKRWIMNV